MIIVTVLMPDTFISSVQTALDEGTFEYAEAISTRVPEGRKLADAQAYNLRLKDKATMEVLLAEFGDQVTLIGAWREETGEQVKPFDANLWLEIMPDLITTDKEGNVTTSRPTEVQEFHKWHNSATRDLS